MCKSRFPNAFLSMVAVMQAPNMEVLCLLDSTILTTVGRALYLQHQVMPVQHQGE